MKCNKFLFIAMIFLVSLLCVSAVSAADDAVSDVLADTNDATVLEESIDDASLKDSQSDEKRFKRWFSPYEISFIYLKNLVSSDEKEIELPSDIEYKDSDNLKVGVKTKKYTITLKNNVKKALKKVKVTLKVNKKTFKVTTNSKVLLPLRSPT